MSGSVIACHEALRGGLDVDLEYLLHASLQFGLEAAERGGPGLGVLADPAVVDEADRDRVQEVELLAASPLGDHQPRLLELLQVLHHAEAGHREAFLEGAQGLAVFPEELVEQAPSRGIGQGSEDFVHAERIGD